MMYAVKRANGTYTGTTYDTCDERFVTHHAQYGETLEAVLSLENSGTEDAPEWTAEPLPLEQVLAFKYGEIINGANAATAQAKKKYSEIEIGTWEEQEVGAITILGLPVTSATKTETAYMLENQVAKDRSVARVTQLAADKYTTPEALAQRIMVNAQEARRLIDLVWQKQSGYEKSLAQAARMQEGEEATGAIARIQAINVDYAAAQHEG